MSLFNKVTKSFQWGDKTVVMETGEIARQASGAVKVDIDAVEKADPKNSGHVPAPFAGMVSVTVSEGDEVEAGDTVATIEAMKMEASITAPVAGTVKRVALKHETQVEGGDLVLVLE